MCGFHLDFGWISTFIFTCGKNYVDAGKNIDSYIPEMQDTDQINWNEKQGFGFSLKIKLFHQDTKGSFIYL